MIFIAAFLFASSVEAQPARAMPIFDPRSGQLAKGPATSRFEASRRGRTPQAQKLNQHPGAEVYRAVYRHIGGCEVPIIVRYGVGR